MNTDWKSFHDRARDPRDDGTHPLHLARHGADARHRADVNEGAPTGDVVCCICWGHARDVDAVHDSHHVPGVPGAVEGCCPAHHVRSRYWIETRKPDETTTVDRRAVADGGQH